MSPPVFDRRRPRAYNLASRERDPMRPKKIVLFTLGLLTVFAALLGLKKLKE